MPSVALQKSARSISWSPALLGVVLFLHPPPPNRWTFLQTPPWRVALPSRAGIRSAPPLHWVLPSSAAPFEVPDPLRQRVVGCVGIPQSLGATASGPPCPCSSSSPWDPDIDSQFFHVFGAALHIQIHAVQSLLLLLPFLSQVLPSHHQMHSSCFAAPILLPMAAGDFLAAFSGCFLTFCSFFNLFLWVASTRRLASNNFSWDSLPSRRSLAILPFTSARPFFISAISSASKGLACLSNFRFTLALGRLFFCCGQLLF